MTSVAAAGATDTAPMLAARLAAVKAAKQINYSPRANGWTGMWTTFDAATIDADLAKAQSLGADSVRAIVFPSVFGYPNPKPEYTAKLAQFVSIAGARGMSVKLTLFDWWNGYTDIAGSSTWATAILAPYRYDTGSSRSVCRTNSTPTTPPRSPGPNGSSPSSARPPRPSH